MHVNTKNIIIMSSGIAVIFIIASLFFINPFNKAVKLINENKEKVETGLKSVELKHDLKKEITKKVITGLDVLHYDINLDLYPDYKKIKGNVTILLTMGGSGEKKIDLDFYDNLIVDSVLVDNSSAKFERTAKTLSIFRNNNADTLNVRIVYEGQPLSLGFGSFTFAKENNKNYVYSLSEPIYASTWFPCVDIPTDKALADISITNDSSMVSLSNGKLISVKTSGSRRTYHWKTYYPIATYLICVYSADYKTYSQKYISINKDTVDLYCYATPDKIEDLKRDFSDHQSYMKIFEELFGPYPFPKEKYGLAEFWWDYGAMENQTLTGIGEKYISGRKFFADMMIHELAHHWWGDAVTPKSWKDIWLNEGFATYSVALYWEKRSGYDALMSTLMAKFGSFRKGTLYNPVDDLFSRLIYDKGAWVLHMLRKEIGDDNFFKLLKIYFKQNEYKNVSTEDFKNLAEKVSGKDLRQFFDQWIYKGEGIINANYSWNIEESNDSYEVEINIEQVQKGYDVYNFPLDIAFYHDDKKPPTIIHKYVDSKRIRFTVPLKEKPTKIKLDPDNSLLAVFNLDD